MEQNIGSSPDGRLWLMKALDPAGQAVDVRGMPDVENHTCAVLNYQTQAQMSPPNLYKLDPSNNMTYDADLYLYQHPLIFASGVSFPSGTVDPLTYSTRITLEFGGTAALTTGDNAKGKTPSISFMTGGKPLFPRTPFVAYNEELGSTDIKEMLSIFQNVSQRHRVIYGAAQLVPTCSANDNSGSISVSQSFFNGDRNGAFQHTPGVPTTENILPIPEKSGKNTYPCEYYEVGDFPEERMIMQNPKALITRFYEGAYIPYKLPNPLETNFINTNQLTVTRTPGWITGAQVSQNGVTWVSLNWTYESQAFIMPKNANEQPQLSAAKYMRLQYLTKTGQTGYLMFMDKSETGASARNSFSVNIELNIAGLLGASAGKGYLNSNSAASYDVEITNAIVQPAGTTVNGVINYGTIGETPICSFPKAPIVSSHMSGLNFRGNIKVMLRIGVEIVCNAGSLYMPMVHISPPYDEAAIKNYIRVSHEMRDAYYGNAAAPEFKQRYMDSLLQTLWLPFVSVDFANRGSGWTGNLRATQPA